MRIGIMGTGGMAAALGGAWVRAGHEVLVGGRREPAAAATAADIGAAAHGTLDEAATYGDAVLAALPPEAAVETARGLAAQLAGRVLIDCTNDLVPGEGGPVFAPATDREPVARRLARAAPAAHVVKAFNVCHVSIWTMPRPTFEGAALAVPLCGDDPAALAQVSGLVDSMGCTPLPCGGLHRAGYLEGAAVFAIGAWWSGAQPRFAFPEPAQAPAA